MLRARALPITLWPVVQGTAPSCPVPLWSGDTRVSAVSGKNFPRGRFLTTSAGSPAGWPGPWALPEPWTQHRPVSGQQRCFLLWS